ncbi:hypothetical protein DPMN_152739 [Dreissena polymorpha]|uniref:Uncharacterized protein n=1 Tax=Dreissena polymorpha TaxID=45954 RepID=A0A9D4FI01_DREPO|nr:hypothetical protein DPMN_152739 [Dreissena polymorpha]
MAFDRERVLRAWYSLLVTSGAIIGMSGAAVSQSILTSGSTRDQARRLKPCGPGFNNVECNPTFIRCHAFYRIQTSILQTNHYERVI